jgi:acyl carrier protein phosphodiesterase
VNYLVHLFLAGGDPLHQLGGLMGDFVKGRIDDNLPERLAEGIRLHRRVDRIAHNSPHTRESRRRLNPRYGHGRGIIVDIFYDYFMARHWDDYSAAPLEEYAESFYATLERNRHLLPPTLQQVSTRMIRHNWLIAYRRSAGVERALHHLAGRLSRPLPLAAAIDDLHCHHAAFAIDFCNFIQQARTALHSPHPAANEVS